MTQTFEVNEKKKFSSIICSAKNEEDKKFVLLFTLFEIEILFAKFELF